MLMTSIVSKPSSSHRGALKAVLIKEAIRILLAGGWAVGRGRARGDVKEPGAFPAPHFCRGVTATLKAVSHRPKASRAYSAMAAPGCA